MYEHLVKKFMNHLHFLATLWGRGLFYLFMSSVVMTHAHSILMTCGALVMTLAFLYIFLHFLSEYTLYGDALGIRKKHPSPDPEGVHGPAEGSLYSLHGEAQGHPV